MFINKAFFYVEMAKRVQSPSSINTYKQCPRKYFFIYNAKLETSENVHTIRGGVVHDVLEKFFDMPTEDLDRENFINRFTKYIRGLFDKKWDDAQKRLKSIDLSDEEISHYYQDSLVMLANWLNQFFNKLKIVLDDKKKTVEEAFKEIKPKFREKEFRSDMYSVRGFIDYIEYENGKVKVMDYKTSKADEMKPEYRLQLAIYALLFNEKYGRHPDKVGLWLLKHGERTIDVNDELVALAKEELELIHVNTESDNIEDYPKNVTPLCKWKTGQCEFYEICFEKENIPKNHKEKLIKLDLLEKLD